MLLNVISFIACAIGATNAAPAAGFRAQCGLERKYVSAPHGGTARIIHRSEGQVCADDGVCCLPVDGPAYKQLVLNGSANG